MQNLALNVPSTTSASPAPAMADTLPRALLPADISSHPEILSALARLASGLRDVFGGNPRLGRTLASHQRWLMAQAAMALHLEYRPEDRTSGLTVGRLRDIVTATSAASRNTVLNFMEEMRHYRFVRDIPPPQSNRQRRRRVEVTEIADQAMRRWFEVNLMVLDYLDGGNRQKTHLDRPDIFERAQPAMARACLADPVWLEPPPHVGLFQWTEGGALVMDELVARSILHAPGEDGLQPVGQVNIRSMADEYLMSHTHLQRLFRKAAELGVIGWSGQRRKADLWVRQDFLEDYARWQAAKLSHLDRAWQAAVAAA